MINGFLPEKAQLSVRTLSEIQLERWAKKERQNIRKAIQEAFSGVVAENKTGTHMPPSFGSLDVEDDPRVVVKGDRKRRRTKIGPITATNATTLTTTHEQHRATSEISDVSSSEMSTPHEFHAHNRPTLKYTETGSYDNDPEKVKSEPESDYGSSLSDDDVKPKSGEKEGKEKKEETHPRPMTAKKQRTSLLGGGGISPIPAQPKAWTVYSAGDKVEAFWNTKGMHNYPAPALPSENGIVEMKSSSHFNF
uniref:Uncharacterized protein n=1 Tax=Caenorhabditis japonica TaxID=281687 RepID=A0A8R1DPY6_CAEJA